MRWSVLVIKVSLISVSRIFENSTSSSFRETSTWNSGARLTHVLHADRETRRTHNGAPSAELAQAQIAPRHKIGIVEITLCARVCSISTAPAPWRSANV